MATQGEPEDETSFSRWPNNKDDYVLEEVIGSGATAVVQKALCVPKNERVAIKRIDLEQHKSSIEELQKEISLMSHCNHPNVIKYFTSFVVKDELWLIMRLMAGGSLLDIIKDIMSKEHKGGVLDEVVIATVLKEVLQGLEYFHNNGQIHRDLKAGNILVGEDGSIQLGDFGVSNWLYGEHGGGKKKKPRHTFVGTPCWMAPEVMEQSGYDVKADIWSFGITALELATGTAPYAKFPPMKVLMLTLENPPPTLDTCCEITGEDYRKNYSKTFQKMVEKCLQKDPEKRPTASELLKNPFFKKVKSKEFIKEAVIGHAPSLTSRAKKVKRVPGTSGRLRRDDDGGWVWSDEEMTEEYGDENDTQKNGQKPQKDKTSSEDSSPKTTSQATPTTVTSDEAASLNERLQVVEQKMADIKIQTTQIQNEEKVLEQGITELPEHQEKLMSLMSQRQEKEREYAQLMFEKQSINKKLQGPSPPTSKVKITEPKVLKIALRKRTEQNQLKDIKFEFVVGTDKPDSIAKDLLSAGLVDGRELVVVAANIQKLLDAPAQKFTFQVGNIPAEQLDEKKLIGYAQIFLVPDKS